MRRPISAAAAEVAMLMAPPSMDLAMLSTVSAMISGTTPMITGRAGGVNQAAALSTYAYAGGCLVWLFGR